MPIDQSLIGREYYAFRDSTHNLIFIEKPELGVLFRSLLDTKEFQRLRRIRQNGLGYLVYPSLETSRFAHSIGSFAVAKRVIEALQIQQPHDGAFGFPKVLEIDEDSAHGFMIAAALHDIGHGPLSHTWDEITSRLTLIDRDCDRTNHEATGLSLVQSPASEIGALFAKHLKKSESYEARVIDAAFRFLRKEHHLTYLRPLLAGNLDIDRLDFIARDTRAAGVTYGQHDLDWLIRSMRFGRLPQEADDWEDVPWVIAIDARKGVNALVQYLRARENMYSLVYLHKTVRAANAHLAAICLYAALQLRSGELGTGDLELLEFLKSGRWRNHNVTAVDDCDVWNAVRYFAKAKPGFLRDFASSFLSRHLFKTREVSGKTQSIIRQMIDDGTLAARFRRRLAKYAELSDETAIPNQLLCNLVVHVDEVPFDIISKEDRPTEQMWIMHRRPVDIGLTDLRSYWRQTVSSDTAKTFRFVHFYEGIQDDVLDIISQLESAFPRIGTHERPAVLPRTGSEHFPKPPDGFEIQKILSDDGKHKVAYLAVRRESDTHGTFATGETWVLKRYRQMSEQNKRVLADRMPEIFRVASEFLTKTYLLRRQEDKAVWLVEKLWIADLLRLVLEGGIRRDLSFLADLGCDLFSGLAELARYNIRHGDLKLENCGVVHRGKHLFRYQIGDFGSSSADPTRPPEGSSGLGTLKSRPPEFFLPTENRVAGLQSDVWSLAATVLAAATGRYPFITLRYDRTKRQEMEQEISKSLAARMKELDLITRDRLPPLLGEILRPCLLESLSNRPPAQEVANLFAEARRLCEKPGTSSLALSWQRAVDVFAVRSQASDCQTVQRRLSAECQQLLGLDGRWLPPKLRDEFSKIGQP